MDAMAVGEGTGDRRGRLELSEADAGVRGPWPALGETEVAWGDDNRRGVTWSRASRHVDGHVDAATVSRARGDVDFRPRHGWPGGVEPAPDRPDSRPGGCLRDRCCLR